MSQKYRSKFEKEVAKYVPDGTKYESARIQYILACSYLADFELPNGITLEAKGRFSANDRRKHLCLRQQRPDLDIRIIFQNPNVRISKQSKTTYGEWCEKHGIKWAKGPKIPEEWLME